MIVYKIMKSFTFFNDIYFRILFNFEKLYFFLFVTILIVSYYYVTSYVFISQLIVMVISSNIW